MSARRSLLLAAALVAATAAAPPGTHDIESRGLWSAFEGSDAEGRAICGITTAGEGGRSITILQHAGETGLDLAFAKTGWQIPDGTTIDVAISFDAATQPAMQGSGSGATVSVALDFAPTVPFMRGFRQGGVLKVSFPSGNEPPWTGGLAGSSAAVDAFNDCRGRFPVNAGPATQPFTSPPAAAPSPAAQPVPPSKP